MHRAATDPGKSRPLGRESLSIEGGPVQRTPVIFSRIAGLVWGRVEHWSDEGCPIPVEELLLEAIRGELGRAPTFPIVTDFDCCHTTPMLTLPQGVRTRLDAHGETAHVTLLEPAVAG